MQAGHRLGHRLAGLVSDALIFVAPNLRVRVHCAPPRGRLDDRSLIPGDDARIASTRFEDWLSHSAK